MLDEAGSHETGEIAVRFGGRHAGVPRQFRQRPCLSGGGQCGEQVQGPVERLDAAGCTIFRFHTHIFAIFIYRINCIL